MSRKMPQVREYMTKSPRVIDAVESLERAHSLMNEWKLRHLPVEKNQHLVGVLSERNLTAIRMHAKADFTVEDAMIPEPFVVAPNAPLDEVVDTMANEKYGCAVIQNEEGQTEGIFTTVDAFRALRVLLGVVYDS